MNVNRYSTLHRDNDYLLTGISVFFDFVLMPMQYKQHQSQSYYCRSFNLNEHKVNGNRITEAVAKGCFDSFEGRKTSLTVSCRCWYQLTYKSYMKQVWKEMSHVLLFN